MFIYTYCGFAEGGRRPRPASVRVPLEKESHARGFGKAELRLSPFLRRSNSVF